MISTAESKSNEMAAASTFSYAQAAKGQSTVPSTTSPNPASQPQGSAPPMGTETPVESSDRPREKEPSKQAATEKHDAVSNVGSESDLRSEATHDRNSESRRDDDAAKSDRPWRQTDKVTRSSSTATRSVDGQESRRPRKGKKSKASSDKQTQDATSVADKTTKEAIQETPKVELSEAPIPSVNIWHERRQQQAKAAPKAIAIQDNEAKKPIKESSAPTSASTVAKEGSTANLPANGVKSNRKSGGDSGRSDRNGSRGSRSAEKDNKSELPPSVEDAASWPTPEIAIREEQKKPAINKPVVAQDKESQDDGSQGKRQKEKWVTYDYVPSVNFETQLPQMRNSKHRGTTRGVNNSRAAAPTSSSRTQSSEKTAAANANASANANLSANANKSTDSKERTKEGGANGSGRTTSLPPVSKRATLDVVNAAKEQKKGAQSGGEKTRDAPSTQPSQYSQQQPPQQPQQQPPQQHQHIHIARSEGRSERGRGGYRGRGGHHSVNTHSHQHSTGFSNNGSASGRPQGPYSPPPQQGSHGSHGQGFVPPHRGGRVRNGAGNNFHRMSLPNGATRLPPIQATFGSSYEFPMHPMSAVPFQQPLQYWDSMVIGVLKNQIEYYFSIENLCKDMYLRKRMDSQGFVHLHFVSAFKRIRELTQDMAMIRAVCETSTEIDFVVGEDDIERIRRRNGWQSFVLPMEDRDDFARNAGPSQLTFKNRALNYGPQFNGAGPLPYGLLPQMGFSPPTSGQFLHFSEGLPTSVQPVNGTINGHSGHNGTPLSANVPDFSPSGPASGAHGQGSTSNHTSQNTNEIVLTNGVHTE